MLFGSGYDFTCRRAASDFVLALEAGLRLNIRKFRLGILDGIFDEVYRQVDRHIAGQFLNHIDEDDLAIGIQQRPGLGENLLSLVDGAEVYRYDDFLVHGYLLWRNLPFTCRAHISLPMRPSP